MNHKHMTDTVCSENKVSLHELETNSMIKNIRNLYWGTYDFRKGYKPRPNIVKDEKSDLVPDSHSILARWRNHFSQLLNVHGVSDVRQTEICTAEPLVHEPSAFEAEMVTKKLKRYKSPGTDEVPVEMIKAGGQQFTVRSINLLILLGIRRN